MNDTDKLVAAILAAAKVSAMGERPSPGLYIAEYVSFREALRKLEAGKPQEVDSDELPEVPEVIEALEKAQKLGGKE